MSPEIHQKLIEIISDELEVDRSLVRPEARFTEDLGADSLDFVEIIMRVEDDFDIDVKDEDIDKFTTVEEVGNYIESLKLK